ncbi:MAG: DUF1156 domain-containing protein [Chloroflexi bacterium]|nr:DUF1156 domain-containing protein [Chloroflexota bacterium]
MAYSSTPYPKRLIEVDLPIKRISAHARREKSIRHGHISTLHIWWARRPLAACRAVLCAALWPDPADEHCPPAFRQAAARLMNEFAFTAASERSVADLCDPVTWGQFSALRQPDGQLDPANPDHLSVLRTVLLSFIADFANWDATTEPHYLATARALTQAAHEALGGAPGTRPLVVDPFAGGGAIPLEALRVGADAFASDLNPVAVLLNKVVLEYIPKYGQRLADEVRQWGAWIGERAKEELAEFYPPDEDGATPIAYLWARTITCEGPGCGTEVPLIGNTWLAKRKNQPRVYRIVADMHGKQVDVGIDRSASISAVGRTVRRGAVTCPVCGFTTPINSVRNQIKKQRGGAKSSRLLVVVTTRSDKTGRFYRKPTEQDYHALQKAESKFMDLLDRKIGSLRLLPDESTPTNKRHRSVGSLWIYGIQNWSDLFTERQSVALATFASLVQRLPAVMSQDDPELALATQTMLGFAFDKLADLSTSLSKWEPVAQCPRLMFVRHALAMLWDFAEGVPIGASSGSWSVVIDGIVRALDSIGNDWNVGQADMASAMEHPLPDDMGDILFTDPPYYDSVAYSDLSDFFYVWLKRTVGQQYSDYFGDQLTPKKDEAIVQHPTARDERMEYEQKMAMALSQGRRIIKPPGIGVVVFAHKSTEGWESLLQAILEAGWCITASWPVDTELGYRVHAQGYAALVSSVHLVCRPREDPDGSLRADDIGQLRAVLDELPRRIHEWMPRLAQEGVVGADAIFACLGPALEVYSRYARVERADGTPVLLGDTIDAQGRVVERGYLSYVWEAVSREALSMIFEGADTADFEADARLTAMWLWTLTAPNGADVEAEGQVVKSTGYTLEYDAARKIAQGLGAHLEQLGDLVEVKGDKARLLPAAERAQTLFGKEGVSVPGTRARKSTAQMSFFEEVGAAEGGGDWGELGAPPQGDTVLDRVHQTMLLFGAGRTEALRRFLVDEGVGQEARFWRLAQALSALYPPHTDEKRWVDGVLARKKGLGF